MLRAPAAWAVDCSDLALAELAGARILTVHDLEQLCHYWATVAQVRGKGFWFDRGCGEQIALPLEHWRATRSEAEALGAPEGEPQPEALQLVLFGGVHG